MANPSIGRIDAGTASEAKLLALVGCLTPEPRAARQM